MGNSAVQRPSAIPLENSQIISEKLRKHRKGIDEDTDGVNATAYLDILAKSIFANKHQHQISEINRSSLRPQTRRQKKQKIDYKWKELSEIGKGSFGVIFKAREENTGKIVAVKKIPMTNNQARFKEIKAEVDLLSNLAHDNIVNFLGYNQRQNYFCIFMDFADGGSLASKLEEIRGESRDEGSRGTLRNEIKRGFPEEVIRKYSEQILEGLVYLHEHKIIHGDIKCANILLNGDGTCKIADFGSAIQLQDKKIDVKDLVGSCYWMSPEAIKSAGLTTKTDIWSFGATVYEMTTTEPPFYNPEGNKYEVLDKIAGTQILPLFDFKISKELEDFIYSCLKQNAKRRPTAKELLNHPFITRQLISKQVNKSKNRSKLPGLGSNRIKDLSEIEKDRLADKILRRREEEASKRLNQNNATNLLSNDSNINLIYCANSLIPDNLTDYYLDNNGGKVYYKKFLDPFFEPLLEVKQKPEREKKGNIREKGFSSRIKRRDKGELFQPSKSRTATSFIASSIRPSADVIAGDSCYRLQFQEVDISLILTDQDVGVDTSIKQDKYKLKTSSSLTPKFKSYSPKQIEMKDERLAECKLQINEVNLQKSIDGVGCNFLLPHALRGEQSNLNIGNQFFREKKVIYF